MGCHILIQHPEIKKCYLGPLTIHDTAIGIDVIRTDETHLDAPCPRIIPGIPHVTAAQGDPDAMQTSDGGVISLRFFRAFLGLAKNI